MTRKPLFLSICALLVFSVHCSLHQQEQSKSASPSPRDEPQSHVTARRQQGAKIKSEFGHERRADFAFAESYVNLNHGSFGATPKVVLDHQRELIEQVEARPDPWFTADYFLKVEEARKRLADYVGADDDDLVLVENASGGVNAVLRALQYNITGDIFLVLSTAYPMVTNTLNYLSEKEHFTTHVHELRFPTDADTIVERFERDLLSLPADRVKFALFSHITFRPALILPVERMAAKCHKHGIPVIVDGAHALGAIPLNMSALELAGVDFYIANGHKWLYSPKGSAYLWASKRAQKGMVPTVISSRGLKSYVDGFAYTGTRDYTAFCSIPAAMDYRQALGDDEIMAYMHNLAMASGQAVADIWETNVMTNQSSMIGTMVDVRIPTNDTTKAYGAASRLLQDYGMPVVVYPLVSGQSTTVWMRLSAQIYLEVGDFVRMAHLYLELLDSPSVTSTQNGRQLRVQLYDHHA